jgi:hypothetical protein
MHRGSWLVLGLIACGKVAGSGPDASTRPIDSGPGGPGDELACFGDDKVLVCLAEVPKGDLDLGQATAINTDTSTMCVPTSGAASAYCVIVATTITISAKLSATGARPLVLLAARALTVTANGVIDVGSHTGGAVGAGADPASCLPGTLPKAPGGGAGGSFHGLGGAGGAGGRQGGVAGGTPGTAVAMVSQLRGGCPGQGGTDSGNGHASGGHGGGAVYLIAGTSIDVGGMILATGQGGGRGVARKDASSPGGSGGGGGAGGMIGLDAPSVTVGGVLLANGGGGGGGGNMFTASIAAADASTPDAAAGGGGDTDDGAGNGGKGSPATPATAPGSPGGNVTSNTTDPLPGGGGGGGGAGFIFVPAKATGGTTSPAITTL